MFDGSRSGVNGADPPWSTPLSLSRPPLSPTPASLNPSPLPPHHPSHPHPARRRWAGAIISSRWTTSLDGSVPLHTYYGCCSGCPVVMGWSWPDRDHEKYKEADYGGNLGEFPSIRYDKIIEYEAACGDAGDYDPLPKIMDKASFRALDLSVMRHGFIDLLPDDKHPYHCQHPDAWLRVMFSRVSQVCRQLSRRNASAPNVLFFFAHPGIDTPQCPAARIREGRSRHRMPLQELAVLRSFCRPSSQHIVRGRDKPGNVQPLLPPPRHAA